MSEFIYANVIISIFILLFTLAKNIAEKNIFPPLLICIYRLALFIFAVPFLPYFNVFSENVQNRRIYEIKQIEENFLKTDNIKDIADTLHSDKIIFYLWVVGIAVNILIYAVCYLKICRFKQQTSYNVLFIKQCRFFGIKADLYTGGSSLPFSAGLLKKWVYIPEKLLHKDYAENIMLHEIIHFKHKDNIFNFVLCIIEAVYWFNPLVKFYCVHMRSYTEIYCDWEVLKYTNAESYARTLTKCAEEKYYSLISSISGKNLKDRILKIKENKSKYSLSKNIIFALVCFLLIAVCGSFSNVNAFSYGDSYPLTKDFERINADFDGTFVLYDMNTKKYYIYNEDLAVKRFPPCSVYKIAIALNAAEEGIISPDNDFRLWNGEKYPFKEWEGNQNINSAMKYSVNWYFQDIDKELGNAKIKNFLDKTNYGNKYFNGNAKNYWLNENFKISAFEQTEFLRKLVEDEYGFKKENKEYVINSIKLGKDYWGKTGTQAANGKTVRGTFAGIYKNYVFCGSAKGLTGKEMRTKAEEILKNYSF